MEKDEFREDAQPEEEPVLEEDKHDDGHGASGKQKKLGTVLTSLRDLEQLLPSKEEQMAQAEQEKQERIVAERAINRQRWEQNEARRQFEAEQQREEKARRERERQEGQERRLGEAVASLDVGNLHLLQEFAGYESLDKTKLAEKVVPSFVAESMFDNILTLRHPFRGKAYTIYETLEYDEAKQFVQDNLGDKANACVKDALVTELADPIHADSTRGSLADTGGDNKSPIEDFLVNTENLERLMMDFSIDKTDEQMREASFNGALNILSVKAPGKPGQRLQTSDKLAKNAADLYNLFKQDTSDYRRLLKLGNEYVENGGNKARLQKFYEYVDLPEQKRRAKEVFRGDWKFGALTPEQFRADIEQIYASLAQVRTAESKDGLLHRNIGEAAVEKREATFKPNFGAEKLRALYEQGELLRVSNGLDVQYEVTHFATVDAAGEEVPDASRAPYYAMRFDMGGTRCVAAESSSPVSATYLWVGEADSGEQWKEAFDHRPMDSRELDNVYGLVHPRVKPEDVGHGERLPEHWLNIFTQFGLVAAGDPHAKLQKGTAMEYE